MSDLSENGLGEPRRPITGFDGLDRVVSGLLHYSCLHAKIKQPVHSYYVASARVVIDPMAPDGIVEVLRAAGGVDRVVLTNRHHYRGAGVLAEAFGCPVHAPVSGLHEFEAGPDVVGYEWGETVAEGVVAHELGAICPDDGAIHIDAGPGALALADAVVGWVDGLAFVPDFLMDDPEIVKATTLQRLEALLGLEFDALLLAHGEPIASNAKAALRAFLDAPQQASFGADFDTAAFE